MKELSSPARIGAVLTAFFVASALVAGEPAGITWEHSVPKAIKAAGEAARPVLVDVWAVWCAPCKLMEEKVWSDPTVRERVEKLIPLKVDADANEVFTARYDAEVLPATLFLDGKGRLITRLTGFADPAMLNQIMDAVISGYDEYLGLAGKKIDLNGMKKLAAYYNSCGNPFEAAAILRKAIKRAKKENSDQVADLELRLAETLRLTERPDQGAKILERPARDGLE